MDRSEVVRCALQGAAKVAFSAALIGCSGVVVEERSEIAGAGSGGAPAAVDESTSEANSSSGTTGSSTATTTSTATTGGEGGALACDAGNGPPYTDATIVCCNTMVEDTFPSGDQIPPPPVTASPSLVACCGVALEARDHPAANGPTPVPWASGYACCGIPGVEHPMPNSPTCSPWGPPSPPSMPADLVWLEEVA